MRYALSLFLTAIVLCVTTSPALHAGETPSVANTRVYFINLKDGDTVKSPLLVQLGLTEQMGVAPALADWPDTGHHHLVIDSPAPNPNKSVPRAEGHVHLNMGQTEITIGLSAGQHTLQVVFGDYAHVMHDPPIMSDVITITVQ